MRGSVHLLLVIGLLWSCTPAALPAELLSKTLLFFPATTKSLEYDDLVQLRKLPNYGTLRQQYANASLERAKVAFAKLGVTDASLQEVVTGSGSEAADSYGIVSGAFSGSQASKQATKAGFRALAIGSKYAHCSAPDLCILFIDDSLAAFGGPNDLRALLEARNGTSRNLGSNTEISQLLGKSKLRAAVIGVAPGSELNRWIGDSAPKELLSQVNLSTVLDSIHLFQYSVEIDRKAHLDVNLECTSSMAAVSLRETLSALSALQSMMGSLSNGDRTPQFENMTVTASGKFVHLTLDASMQ